MIYFLGFFSPRAFKQTKTDSTSIAASVINRYMDLAVIFPRLGNRSKKDYAIRLLELLPSSVVAMSTLLLTIHSIWNVFWLV